jgi:hypothetical protein
MKKIRLVKCSSFKNITHGLYSLGLDVLRIKKGIEYKAVLGVERLGLDIMVDSGWDEDTHCFFFARGRG